MRVRNSIFLLGFLIVFTSCEKKETMKNEAKLLAITLKSGTAVVDTANRKVLLKIPNGIDISTIVPHIEISPSARIYPPSDVATNFSNPVTYTITSQDESKQYIFTVSAVRQIAKFTVYDCSTWSQSIPRTLQPGATITIYSNEIDFNTPKTYDVLTTDQNACADFYGEKGKAYFVTVKKDNKSNIINGYVLDGRYDNQAEIQSSPNYSGAVIGGLKFKDIDEDWYVWPQDKSNYDWIRVYGTGVQSIDLYVSSAK